MENGLSDSRLDKANGETEGKWGTKIKRSQFHCFHYVPRYGAVLSHRVSWIDTKKRARQSLSACAVPKRLARERICRALYVGFLAGWFVSACSSLDINLFAVNYQQNLKLKTRLLVCFFLVFTA